MNDLINSGGIKAYMLDLFFPNRCPFCDSFIAYDMLCCEQCFNEVLWADENICLRCGKSLLKGCMCGEKTLYYDMCVPAAYYTGKAKEGVLTLKYKKGTAAAAVFGRVLNERLDVLGILGRIDCVCAVPMTKRGLRQRGYNQAELIAVEASGKDIPFLKDVLIRKNVHTEQHLLNAQQRSEAVSEQYFVNEKTDLAGKTVLLADDVLTTGATLNYCSYLLKKELHADSVICAVCTTV